MKKNFICWVWKQELSPEICQDLINLGEGKWNAAKTFGSEQNVISLENVRKSEIVWIKEQWVYDLVWPYMVSANENAGWKYEITEGESCQVTRYTKDGFYSWHRDWTMLEIMINGMDSHNEVRNEPVNKFLHGNIRKLSMSIILNDDFEGGDFEIFEEDTPKLPKGSIIIFPSFMPHRVAPVTKGTRYSLVVWFVGPSFK